MSPTTDPAGTAAQSPIFQSDSRPVGSSSRRSFVPLFGDTPGASVGPIEPLIIAARTFPSHVPAAREDINTSHNAAQEKREPRRFPAQRDDVMTTVISLS